MFGRTQSPSPPLRCPRCGYDLRGQMTSGQASKEDDDLPLRCPECGAETTKAKIEEARRRRFLRRFAPPLLIHIVILYTPYSWLLFIDYPMSDYRLMWLKMWPVLPGLMPTMFLRRWFDPSFWPGEYVLMGVIALAILAILVWIGSRGRWWLLGSALVVTPLSIWSGIGAYYGFLM